MKERAKPKKDRVKELSERTAKGLGALITRRQERYDAFRTRTERRSINRKSVTCRK
jgi:hypothetical protein